MLRQLVIIGLLAITPFAIGCTQTCENDAASCMTTCNGGGCST